MQDSIIVVTKDPTFLELATNLRAASWKEVDKILSTKISQLHM